MEYSEINRVGRSIEKASSEMQHKHLVIIISSLEKRVAELEREKRLGFSPAKTSWEDLRQAAKTNNPYTLNYATAL